MGKLVLQTGVKNYDIYDENDKMLGTINIYPNDFNFGARAKEIIPQITEYIESAEQIADDDVDGAIDQIKEIDDKIKGALDYLFASNISGTIFKTLHCLDVVAGGNKFFIESFLDMMMPVITKEMEKASKESAKRIKSYTAQVIDE